MIPYPFQMHFKRLPNADVVRECRDGLQNTNGRAHGSSFPELLVDRFGEGIARHFLVPYNQKLWGDLSRLATDWVQERVAAPRGTQESFSETGGIRKPLQSDTTVAYPARGGFEETMLALARRLNNLRLGQTVVQVDPRRRELVTRRGEVISWSRLISTIPIDLLLEMISSAPADLLAASRDLVALPVDLVLMVTRRPVETSIQRVYCAGPEIPAHKIVLNHNSSPYLRSLPHHGIQAEVSGANGPSTCPRELIENVVRGLIRMGLLESPGQILTTKVVRVPRAYPVPTRDRDRIMAQLAGWLEDRGIYTVGRFGQWAYINADEALHRGLVLGRRILRCAWSPSVA
jgi:protoporphyrinogen oxidase